jgi:peptidoglycan/xylan/chitin deacetylase (PgdA/CDA1 family)
MIPSRLKHPLARLADRWLGLRSFERGQWRYGPAVSFVFDDGYATDLGHGARLLESFGVRGVFAPTVGSLGTPGHLSVGKLREIADAGHEIASHMDVHLPLWDRRITDVREALPHAKAILSEMAGSPVDTLVYPHGANTRRLRYEAARVYASGVGTWVGMNGRPFNRYAIRRHPLGSYTKRGRNRLQDYLGLLEKAREGETWLVFMLHSGAAENDVYQSDCLARVIERSLSAGLRILTVRDAMAELASHEGAAGVASPTQKADRP